MTTDAKTVLRACLLTLGNAGSPTLHAKLLKHMALELPQKSVWQSQAKYDEVVRLRAITAAAQWLADHLCTKEDMWQ